VNTPEVTFLFSSVKCLDQRGREGGFGNSVESGDWETVAVCLLRAYQTKQENEQRWWRFQLSFLP